jgi:hypothetical protein
MPQTPSQSRFYSNLPNVLKGTSTQGICLLIAVPEALSKGYEVTGENEPNGLMNCAEHSIAVDHQR